MPAFSTTRYKDWTPKVGVGLRPVRRRQDGAQGQRRPVRPRTGAGRRRPRQPARLQRPADVVAHVDRQQQELHPGLRPHEPASQGPTQTGANRQIDTCLAPVGANALFYSNSLNPEPRRAGRRAVRVGQAAVQLGVLRQRAARDRPGHLGQRRRVQAMVRQLPRHRRHQPPGHRLHGRSAFPHRRFRRLRRRPADRRCRRPPTRPGSTTSTTRGRRRT